MKRATSVILSLLAAVMFSCAARWFSVGEHNTTPATGFSTPLPLFSEDSPKPPNPPHPRC